MAYARRDIVGGAPASTLSSGIASGDTSLTIASGTNWATGANGDFFICIDRGNAGEEKVRCASRTGTTLTVQTAGRGSDGTSAAAHASGVTVELVITATDADEANYTVSKTVAKATAVGQILVVDSTNSFAAVQAKTSGQVLIGNGTTLASTALSGDVTVNGSGVTAIGSGKVLTGMIGTGQVTSANILDLTIATGDIAALAITTAKLADANVTTAKIADANVTTAKLATGAVTANELGADAVTSAKILDGTIVTADLADSSVTSAKIADATIVAADIAAAVLTQALMASEAPSSFTPSISGTGWALGNGTAVGKYLKYGRLIHADILITFGSTSTYGTGGLTVAGLPIAVMAGIGASARVFLSDSSASKDFYGDWSVAAGATSGAVYANGIFSAPGAVFRSAVDKDTPFTWATGDSVELHLDYIGGS